MTVEKAAAIPRSKKYLKCRYFNCSFQTEYKLDTVKEMFENYVKEPEAEQLIYKGLVKTAFVNVKHKGFRTLTGRKMFYGPDRFAWMRALSHIPASQFTLKCQNCQELGHLKFHCKKEQVCVKCRKP